MGVSGEGQMITHQAKKMTEDALLAFRDRFELPLTDEQVRAAEYYKPPEDSPEMEFLRERRAALGGSLPVAAARRPSRSRCRRSRRSQAQLEGTGEREISTTMAFVRVLAALLRDKAIGRADRPDRPRRVAHVRDGGDVPPGRDLLAGRPALPAPGLRAADVLQGGRARPDPRGGDHRGRARSPRSSPPGRPTAPTAMQMVPFYIYYSMFGYQRVGDLVWAAGDSRTRGFLLGGTAGRTTLNGEGLQHEDGHSHVLFSVVPNCRAYDPAFALRGRGDHPGRPAADGRRAGGRLLLPHADERELPAPADARGRRGRASCAACTCCVRGRSPSARGPRVQLLGSGTILREVLAAADLLEADFGVPADVWSVTSFTELRRDGIEVERWNMLHPLEAAAPRVRRPSASATARPGRSPRPTTSGRSPTRSASGCRAAIACSGPTASAAATSAAALRRFFEVDRHYVAVAALKAWPTRARSSRERVQEAIERYEIDAEAPMPTRV